MSVRAVDAFRDFNEQVARWVETRQLPGVHHLQMRDDDVLNEQIVGFADIEADISLHPNSLFRLASASKIFISAGFLTLIDDGALCLEDEVADVLPEYKALQMFSTGGQIQTCRVRPTMIDLLRHTCGFGYGADQPYRGALEDAGLLGIDEFGADHWRHRYTLHEWAQQLARVPMESKPGTAVVYGLGHDLLGAVVESVGMPLDEFMQRRLFTPLALHDTGFVVPPERADDLTAFYIADSNGLRKVESARDSEFLSTPRAFSGGGGWDMLGNGGLVSSARDFARLLRMIMQQGCLETTQVLQPESVRLLTASMTDKRRHGEMMPGTGYAAGVGCVTNPADYSGHGGQGKMWWGGSTNTYYYYLPEQQKLGIFLTHTFPFAHLGAIYKFDRLAETHD